MSKVYEFYNPFEKKEQKGKTQSFNGYEFNPRFHDKDCDFGCGKHKEKKEDKKPCHDNQFCPPFPCSPACQPFPYSPQPCPPFSQPLPCCFCFLNCSCKDNLNQFPFDCIDNNFRYGMIYFNCQMPICNCFDNKNDNFYKKN